MLARLKVSGRGAPSLPAPMPSHDDRFVYSVVGVSRWPRVRWPREVVGLSAAREVAASSVGALGLRTHAPTKKMTVAAMSVRMAIVWWNRGARRFVVEAAARAAEASKRR